jgi:hypothetical protein
MLVTFSEGRVHVRAVAGIYTQFNIKKIESVPLKYCGVHAIVTSAPGEPKSEPRTRTIRPRLAE